MAYNFKSEEEVKEYIKNIGIEYRFGCFSEKKPEVCHLLGDYLESISKNYEKAFKIYENNCNDSNFGNSCLKTGDYFMQGRGGAKEDKLKALDYYEKGCKLGNTTACFRAGMLSIIFSANETPVRNYRQAIELFESSCQGSVADACFHLSGIFLEGNEKENIPKDLKRSLVYATKACDLDNMYACANLSLMYTKGDGVDKDLELAKKFRAKAEDIQEQIKNQQQQIKFQEGLS